MTSSPVLLDIGTGAYAHQAEVDRVKQRIGVHHNYFDCWIYGFLENKNFNVDETVEKLRRRADFERTQLAACDITDWMMENMRKGIIQVVGNDKVGRVTFYVATARDRPVASRREESRKNFDMLLAYGTRLRPESKRCQIAMLVNQEKASMISNLDMTLQADIALRIAKYYPGCVDKIYICKMGRMLAAMAKPIFSRLPAIVSERIIIISESDIRHGKLLEVFDASVLPVELGGKNNCDSQERYDNFATTIRNYFDQLKAAVQRGEGVKEWELNNLRAAGCIEDLSPMDALKRSIIEPSPSMREQFFPGALEPVGYSLLLTNGSMTVPSLSPRTPALGTIDIDDDANLLTCATDSMELDAPRWAGQVRCNASIISHSPPRSLFADYVHQFITIESFFRLSVAEMHERQWLQIVQSEVQERRALLHGESVIRGDKLLAGLPPSVLLLAKGFLWLCLIVTSSFFFLGTCFIALLGVVTLIHIFFAIFVHPFQVFLYGAAFIVAASQFVILCSRGFDVTRSTFEGRVVQAFRGLGAKALAVQLVIYVGCTIAFFVLFCVMAARHDVLTGLQYSIAYGWIVAVCLIFIYHVVFAFGFRTLSARSYAHGSRQNNAEATVYLFMEVEMEDDNTDQRCPATEVMLLTVVGVLSVAMGTAFLTGGGFFFLCATIVAQAVLLLLCTIFMIARSVSSSSDIIICGAFYASVFWMNAIFTLSQNGWSSDWGSSTLAVLFVMLFFVITGMVSVFGPWKGAVRRWFFRVSWLLLLLHLIGCVTALMVFNYRFGLFVAALALHLLLGVMRANETSNNFGIFTMTTGFTLVLLACCLLAYFSDAEVYEGSVSSALFPNYAHRPSASPASWHLRFTDRAGSRMHVSRMATPASAAAQSNTTYVMPPLCLAQFGPTLDVLGMALFAKLGLNDDAAAQKTDLHRWFPSFKRLPTPEMVDTEVMHLDAFREETPTVNTTIVTSRPGSDSILLIESMAMWIDTYALSFFSFLMPAPYVERLLPYLTFAQRLVPAQWKISIDKTTSVVNGLLSGLSGDRENVFFVGHGPVGSRAAVIGLRIQQNVNSVTFSGPPVVLSKYDLSFSPEAQARRMLSVQTMPTVLSTWYLRTASMQFIPCRFGGNQCDRMDTTIQELMDLCDQ
ncbi:hypothetical protein LSCM1_01334 [Leishmania martiniquensis]|uniref:CRAL-TRIO domain-containing protein n=1 Tax=Leishmania martiniquensis TaxID=1580590 RepID=A0A836KER7_9TRYP|nr:hypothetical protein LSCM1_01334 [Leishmania martiniquensis]